jgi:hypothetical protein
VTGPDEAVENRRTALGHAVRRGVFLTAVVVVALGLVGAVIGWATGHGVSATIAVTYYLVGCVVFLIGMAPSGGFSMRRGTFTRRRPTGSRTEPVFLLGLVLIGLGVVADVTRPF